MARAAECKLQSNHRPNARERRSEGTKPQVEGDALLGSAGLIKDAGDSCGERLDQLVLPLSTWPMTPMFRLRGGGSSFLSSLFLAHGGRAGRSAAAALAGARWVSSRVECVAVSLQRRSDDVVSRSVWMSTGPGSWIRSMPRPRLPQMPNLF